MKSLLYTLLAMLALVSCSKEEEIAKVNGEEGTVAKSLSTSLLEDYSDINKSTSWYRTNSAFDEIFDIENLTRDFERVGDEFLPIDTFRGDRVVCCYYYYDEGQYLFTDLNGDGKKDLWASYIKQPWGANEKGLLLYKNDINSETIQLDLGLTQVRKQVLSDFFNDGKPEIMLFSTGSDKEPFPGDSLAFFDVEKRSYRYSRMILEDIILELQVT